MNEDANTQESRPSDPPKPKRMLYEECQMCKGGWIGAENGDLHNCVCTLRRVVETGATVVQLERMAELDVLRQGAGISAATMLRDGRAGAFRDFLASCNKALEVYDAAHAQNGVRSREEQLAYQRGYSAGCKGVWPEHKPPLPPDSLIRKIIEAMQKLRDCADSVCATLSEDDEFCVQFDPGIQAVDEAMIEVGKWLKAKDQNGDTAH